MKLSDAFVNILVIIGVGGSIMAGLAYSVISDSEYAMTISFFGTIFSAFIFMLILDTKSRATQKE